MAMDKDTLSAAIADELKTNFNLDSVPADMKKLTDGIAKAVIEHIQDNAEVNSDTGKIE